jgi:ubiquinone biosynthesis protein COQ9
MSHPMSHEDHDLDDAFPAAAGGADDAAAQDPEAARRQLLDRLVEEMLGNVPFDGWSRRSVHAAADMLDMDTAYADTLLADLPDDALDAFSDWADRQMLAAWAEMTDEVAHLRLRERVARAVLLRLEILEPHRDAVRRAAALLALPPNAALGARLVARTVDRIWQAAGDRSADFSYYTKRLTLAGALSTTTLFWLNDSSGDLSRTARFLDRRIDGILRAGRLVSRAGRFGSDVTEAPFRLAARLQRRGRS